MLQTFAVYIIEYSSRGIADGISRAIRDGSVPPGTKLPSIRRMAEQFQCSPTTVSAAWALLGPAGLIHTDRRRGTVVLDQPRLGRGRYRKALGQTADLATDLSTGTPDPALLPDLAAALIRLSSSDASRSYLTDPVVPALHEHLSATWPFETDVLTIADGAMDALDLIVTTQLRFGDRVAVENPCFPPLLDLLEAAGVQIVPVELDGEGLRPDSLAEALKLGPRAVFLQPRAQNPTGATMTADRRDELVDLLRPRATIVVENDSSGAMASTSLNSIGLRLPEKTVHVRSFSKSHGPDLRLAAIGGPRSLVEPMVNRRFLGQSWTSHLLQKLLLDLLTHDSSNQQVERARVEYAKRRLALTDALADNDIRLDAADGLNLWLPVADEPSALISLTRKGIGVAPGSPFMVGSPSPPFVRVTTAHLADGQTAVAGALAAAAKA